jgi:hypothetical protein
LLRILHEGRIVGQQRPITAAQSKTIAQTKIPP